MTFELIRKPSAVADLRGKRAWTAPPYRADVDGLRGVAVILVLGFHAFPARVPGGFVGVDVFFVISGFLISGIVLHALANGNFSLVDFFARRIRRLFPALILVLIASFGLGWLVFLPDDFTVHAKHILGGAGFVSNFLLWSESGYFDKSGLAKPLLHLWSLGVEEQFYLLWPLAMMLAYKRGLSLFLLAALSAVASFVLNVSTMLTDAPGAFYSPGTRFWEFMLGAGLACVPKHGVVAASSAWRRMVAFEVNWAASRELAGLVGAVLIAVAVCLFDGDQAFPGWRALLPVLGALLVIAAGPTAWVNKVVLSHRGLVALGLISYPLYLWTWPLLSFASILQYETPSRTVRVVVLIVGMCLAWLTYHVIERRVRFGVWRRHATPVLCGLMCMVCIPALLTIHWDGFAQRAVSADAKALFLQRYKNAGRHAVPREQIQEGSTCAFFTWSHEQGENFIPQECAQSSRQKTWVLWGDSYAASLSSGMRQILPADVRLVQITTPNCPPGLDSPTSRKSSALCAQANGFALRQVVSQHPELVMLAQASDHESTNWGQLAARIHVLGGKGVFLVGPSPQWLPSLPLVIAKNRWGG